MKRIKKVGMYLEGGKEMKQYMKTFFLGICLAAVLLTGCAPEKTGEKAGVDYSLEENWAYCENGEDEREADVFFICPTVFG